MPFGPCPVLIPSCSWAVYGSLWQALFEFRPKHCQGCAERTRQLQPCSWFWLCSFTCSKFISFFRSTNQHARQDHRPDLSLHSSNSHMQDKELDPQKEQHLPSYMACITHAGKHWGVFQQHMVSSVGSTVSCPLWQRHHRLTSHALLQDMLVGHCGEGWMLAAQSVH